MSGPLSANAEEFRAVQQLVNSIADEMAQQFGKLADRGDALVDDWPGETGKKYTPGWEQWKAGFGDVLGALQNEAGLLGESGQKYEHRDGESGESIADIVAGIKW